MKSKKDLRKDHVGYDDQGSGQVILFIHGYPLNRQIWAPQVAGLSDRARVLAVDLRGHGDSDPVNDDHSMDNLAEDCKRLLESLSIHEPVVLCGLSMGGYISLAFYRKYPELIRGLVLTATRAAADTPAAREGREKAILTVKESGSRPVIESMLPKLVSPSTLTGKPDLVERLRKIMSSIPDRTVINDLLGLKERPDSTPLLPKMSFPVLILHGEDDQIVPLDEARSMQQSIAHSRLVILPQAGHLLNMEQPALFNQAVRKFLEEILGNLTRNKKELLEALESQREKFMTALDDLADDDWTRPGVAGEWSIKDILMHISRWEAELVKLLWQAQRGQRPDTIHFSHVNVDEVNARWYVENRDRSLEKVLEDFQAVRAQTILRVEAFSEKDITDQHRYPWSSGKALWEWIENDSFGHEEEHLQDILRWKEASRS